MDSTSGPRSATRSIDTALRAARYDSLVLAVVYLGLGLLILAGIAAGIFGRGGPIARNMPLAISCAICLLLPGAGYVLLAVALHGRQWWALPLGFWLPAAHLAVSVSVVVLVNLARQAPIVAFPGGASLFFMPAAIALVAHARAVRTALRDAAAEHAFHPVMGPRPPEQPL